MKKIRLLALFLISFFVSFVSVNASPLDSQKEFNAIYRKIDKNGLELVAETKQMTDFTNEKNNVTIQIYYDQVEKLIFFYKKVVNKEDYTLLAVMGKINGEVITNTFCVITDEAADTCEQYSSAPIKEDLSCSVDPVGDQPGKVTQAESNSIYDEIINHKNDNDKLKELTANMGLVVYHNEDFNTTYEGLAYSNDASPILDENKKNKCPDIISIPEGGGYTYKNTSFVDQKLNVIKSNYTVKIRKVATKLEAKKTEKYEKNPCNTVGVLKALRISRRVINIIKTLVPIVLIIIGSVELVKVVTSGDANQISKSTKNLIGKVILGLIIFFIPTIVTAFVNLIPKNDTSSFSNCSACFFGDSNFSSATCDQKIDGEISMTKDAKDFYNNWKTVESKCAKNFKSYVDNSCGKVPYAQQQQCRDGINLSSYVLSCVCEDENITSYTKEAAEAKCEELYPKSKRDQGFEKVINDYDSCMKDAANSKTNVLTSTCKDELKGHYSNNEVIENLEKLTK